MKSFIYFLGILALGYAGELKCDNIAPIMPVDNPQTEELQIESFWSGLNDLYEEIAAIVSGDLTHNKATGAPQINKQGFDLLVRKHIQEQKNFLGYMQATSISLTFLMTAITIIMSSAFIKALNN